MKKFDHGGFAYKDDMGYERRLLVRRRSFGEYSITAECKELGIARTVQESINEHDRDMKDIIEDVVDQRGYEGAWQIAYDQGS